MKSPTRSESAALPAAAVMLMLLLCAAWGLNMVAVKLGNAGIPPTLGAGLRSAVAALLLWGWCRARGIPLNPRGTWLPGLAIGLFFTVEFLWVFQGLRHTTASRAVVFLYAAPFFVAAGTHWLLPDDRLTKLRLAGLVVAFVGLVVAFSGGFSGPLPPGVLLGDAMLLGAGILWAATTVLVKASVLKRARPELVLQYQLVVSALVLLPAAALSGEAMAIQATPLVVGAFVYQAVGIAFASYSAWFWLVSRHSASRLSAFSFVTPLFGVAAGALLLQEPLGAGFLVSVGLVALGLWLVNRVGPARLQ